METPEDISDFIYEKNIMKNGMHNGFPDFTDDAKYTPERRLIASVLSRAVLDLVSNEPQVAQASRAWFEFKEKPTQNGITYAQCCNVLDIDSDDFLEAIHHRGFFDLRLKGQRRGNIHRMLEAPRARISQPRGAELADHLKDYHS